MQAVRALGKLGVGDRTPHVLSLLLRVLFAMHTIKHEEVHFAVGEALSDVARGLSARQHLYPITLGVDWVTILFFVANDYSEFVLTIFFPYLFFVLTLTNQAKSSSTPTRTIRSHLRV